MPATSDQYLVVPDDLRGVALLDFLARSRPAIHRQTLRQWLGAGHIRVNGELTLRPVRLRAGDVVAVPGAGAEARPAPRQRRTAGEHELPRVLWESATALVIDKPAGVPVVPDRSGRIAGIHGLLERLRPAADLRIVHRLDRDTSGCLLLAKGLQAAQHFDAEFRAHALRKEYLALVHGVPTATALVLDAWLGPDPRRPGKVVASPRERPGFRAARSDVEVVAEYGRAALCRVRPHTGRGHQIRVHLANAGHPIVGDRDYGGAPLLLSEWKPGYKLRPGTAETPLLERMFLHAIGLAGNDLGGAPFAVESPLPADLQRARTALERCAGTRR